MYNLVSDVDIVSDLQNTQLYTHQKYFFNTILIVHPTSTRLSAKLRNRMFHFARIVKVAILKIKNG